jgi:hypothetical protein
MFLNETFDGHLVVLSSADNLPQASFIAHIGILVPLKREVLLN